MIGQAQNGNNSLDHIGAGYDYMYAVASVPTNGNVNFDFKHATSIIMLELTMPDAAAWQRVTLANKSGDKVFTTSATMDVTTGAVTSKETASEITLLLNNVSTTASSKTLTLYLAVLPTMTGNLTLTAETSANKSYTATIAGKTLVAGKAYRFTASPATTPFGNGYENGYAYVDLGLSVKWAAMNIGATSVTDYGKYYAWGETIPQANNTYDWASYKWCNGSNTSMTKYCVNSSCGTVDNKTVLAPEDDAATQSWGGAWRMPTHAEQEELVNNCYWVWTSNYKGSGVAGYIVYAAKSLSDRGQIVYSDNTPSSNYSIYDSHIFLPGHRYYSQTNVLDFYGRYWSSSLNANYGSAAWSVFFCSSARFDDTYSARYVGHLVRAVCE